MGTAYKHNLVQVRFLPSDLREYEIVAGNAIKGIQVKIGSGKAPSQNYKDFRVSFKCIFLELKNGLGKNLTLDPTSGSVLTAEAFFHEMQTVFFRSLIDKSDIGSNSWYNIEFDIPLPPWDGTKTLILEFSHMCDNEYFDIGAIVESNLYYDSNGNVFSNEVGRTQYMIIKQDKCGNYPYAGLYYVNMDSRINTFGLPQAYPGATQVLVTLSFLSYRASCLLCGY